MTVIDCAGKELDLSRPCVMGVLNITPDSFSDGGDFISCDAALSRARQMMEEGAAIIDVGGESTRPGAEAVTERQELDRVLPVIRALNAELPVPISIDTSKPAVMREAVAAGAGMINDVMALRTPGAIETAKEAGVPICLMHMQGSSPRTMQKAPYYEDVVRDVKGFLIDRVAACGSMGIGPERLILDPGFGFGKSLWHNNRLLRDLMELKDLCLPLLVGISRKSMIGAILDNAPVDQRLFGSIAAAVMAVDRGASILRVHDVRPTVEALKVFTAVSS